MRPPACASALCIFSWMAFSVAMSKKAAADARLVGGDDDAEARVIQPRDRLEAAGNRPPFVRRLDELLAVAVDHAVAIEHDQLDGAGLGDRFGGELDHGWL